MSSRARIYTSLVLRYMSYMNWCMVVLQTTVQFSICYIVNLESASGVTFVAATERKWCISVIAIQRGIYQSAVPCEGQLARII